MRTAISGEFTVKEPSVYIGLARGEWAAAKNWVRASGRRARPAWCSVRPILRLQATKLVQKTGESVIDAERARFRREVTTEVDIPPL